MLVPAALVDVHERRLPNQIIVVGSIVFVGGCVVESMVGVSLPVESIVVGVVAMALPLFTMHLASPASMGFGDVKLGVALGAVAGSVDWRLALWALVLASGASAAIAISRRRRTLAFGPGLIGATIALLALTAVAPDDRALEDADRTLYVVDS